MINWRVRHFKIVQRVIGADVIGTQGTPVEVMGRLIHHSFYPELWDVRNDLTDMNPPDDSGISLGCGNFGGVGSAPEFFGQGIARRRGVRDHGSRVGRGITGSTPATRTAAARASVDRRVARATAATGPS